MRLWGVVFLFKEVDDGGVRVVLAEFVFGLADQSETVGHFFLWFIYRDQ